MSKARNMARMGQDTSAGYTGAFDMPAGTTAERPASAGLGWTRLNTDTGSVEVYDGTNWNAVTRPFISSVTGTIYAGAASNLVIAGQNFTSTITVRFLEGGSTVADVSGVSVSAGSATVAVPAAVYGQTAGDSIEVKIINSDGTLSANGITKTVQALPTGGTITTSGGYRIHTFTSSSNLVVPSGLTLSNVEYLIVAGGGGGGFRYGGGGAGGYRSSVVGEPSGGGASAESRMTLSPATYAVTIGSGGAGSTSDASIGNTGNTSSFNSISSTGGGGGAGGAGDTAINGGAGGSGGGGSGGGHTTGQSSGGSGTSGQGYAGGAGWIQSGANAGGGGGGAGQAGGSATSSSSLMAGGNGVQSSINGTATYRAGGGAPSNQSPANGTAGLGGGGTAPGGNGTANTGGGGGSGRDATGGNGGSGVVIIRYAL